MKKSLLTLVMALVSSVMLMAQVTTSALSGIVTDDLGPVIGVTVQAIHVPSGTRYGTITNEKGAYAIRGMRVGGPYEVIISYVGAKTQKFEDITLELGETYSLNTKLLEDTDLLDEVIVVGSGSKFSSEKTGATTNIKAAQMTSMPTVSRSITEFTRLSPYGGDGMTFGGSDGRTANFTIDGANFNNNFGLNEKLPGGGNPVSIDAIEEMQVVISPYDLSQTGFVGGGVNAVTKSGTNTFKGTAYVYHRNENMRGDAVEREQINSAREKDQQTTYGFTLGGPIIKDKLFFFTNFEMVNTPTIANRWRASRVNPSKAVPGQMNLGEAEADNYISRTSDFDLQQVASYVSKRYDYETGSYSSFPADESNKKFLIRLDWNINSNHHLAVRYNYTKNRIWNAPNASSMDGGTRASGARTSQYAMSFSNSMYAMDNIVHTGSLELNSRFTDNLSNRFIATFSKLDDVRDSDSSQFPFIDILDGEGQNYIALGYELFTWNNAVHNTIANIKDDVTYYWGKHKFTAGLFYEYQMADNQYMRNGTGYYRYSSLEDFLSEAAPEIVCLTYGYDGEQKPAARVTFNKAGVYLQDEWNITPNLKLNYGLRVDGLFFDNGDIMRNQALYDVDYNGTHVDTGKWPNSSITVCPRVGFSWDVFGDKSLKLRGGSGFFQGRLPLVFFTNMPTNSGMVQYNAQLNAKSADMSQFAGGLVTDGEGHATIEALYNKITSMGYPTTISPTDGTLSSGMCAVDPDFKLPLVWKTSLAVDYAFPTPFPLSISAEGIFTKNLYETTLSDWSVPSINGFARFNGADARPIFPEGFQQGKALYMLENTSKGYGFTGSVTINADPTKNISLMAAYTHTIKKEITSLPGSNASSVLNYVSTVQGPNAMLLHNGANVRPHRFIANATIHDGHGNHYSFIYETIKGTAAYSYEMVNDMNGDGFNYDALYIPTDEEVASGQFRFVSDYDRDCFMAFVHNNDYLKKHQGEYAEPYSVYNPWRHSVDFSYKHDFNFKVAKTKHCIQLSADIKNLMNLFSSSWGLTKYGNPDITGSSNDLRVLKYEGVDAQGYPTFSTPVAIYGDTEIFQPNKTLGQCWYMSVGVKYIFN